MILVTGAAGKTGRAVIQALTTEGEAVRALVYRSSQIRTVKALGAKETVAGDMRNPDTIEQISQGIRAVYHICPNVSPDEVVIGQTVIAAAQNAGIEHFVFHSVLHPQTEAMPHHWQKLRVEELLLESDLPFTILQPAIYMQNILNSWDQILADGVYLVPYAVETQLSMVDLVDVAEAAAIVLTEPDYVGGTYELVGTEALSQTRVATMIGQQLNRPIHAQAVSLEAWERQARASGLGDYQVKTLIKMFRYYERYGFWGSPRVLSLLLRRSPTTFETFLGRIAQE